MKSLRSKLIVETLAIAVAIIAILAVVAVGVMRNNTENALEDTMIPLAQQTSEKLDMIVDSQGEMLATMANGDVFLAMEDVKDQLDFIDENYFDEYMIGCAMFSTDGKQLDSIGTSPAVAADEAFLNAVFTTGLKRVSDIVENGDDYCYAVAAPVFAKGTNRVDKIISVLFDVDSIRDRIGSVSFGKTGGVIIVDGVGNVIVGPENKKYNAIDKAKTDESYKSEADFIRTAVTLDSGFDTYEKDGETYLAAFCNPTGFWGSIIVSSRRSDFDSLSNGGILNLLIIGLVLLFVTVVVIVLFAKTISTPIVKTTNRLRALSQGNLSDPVDVCYSKDELGVLSNSLEETVVSLRQYINLITVALTNISDGNLCHRVDGTFRGDFMKIKSTFNSILESLSDTFASINIAAEQVSNGAVQVSNNAQALSQGSTQQASSIEELSATLDDVAEQTDQNAQSAKDAYKIVQSNADAIASCNQDMEKMLAAMNEISVSSSEISKIIKVIDEISFQTNILALNAAVEAAREGSKGFGVVADEVRRLASKSAEAAKQTAALIENSASAIARGSEIAQQTAGALHRIVEDSIDIKKLVKDISDASEHQAEAIVQINTGVDQISAVVASNTATAVGSASASEELSSQSLILKNMIARFKLSKNEKRSEYMYDYVSDDDQTETAAEETASGFEYPSAPQEDEVKIVLDDDEEKFDPNSVNDQDDKY